MISSTQPWRKLFALCLVGILLLITPLGVDSSLLRTKGRALQEDFLKQGNGIQGASSKKTKSPKGQKSKSPKGSKSKGPTKSKSPKGSKSKSPKGQKSKAPKSR